MNFNFTFNKKTVTHIVGWIGYFIFWFLQYNVGNNYHLEVIEFTAVQMFFHMLAIYLNNYFLITSFLYKQQYVRYITFYLIIICIIGFLNFKINSQHFVTISNYLYSYNNLNEGISISILLVVFSTSIPAWFKVNSDRLKSDNDAKQLMNDKIEEELKFLKAQINPHFLFNSLNTVFNLIDSNTEEAKNTLARNHCADN